MSFKIKKPQSSNKTIRLPNDLIAVMEDLAFKHDLSFNQLVIQCCRYALADLDEDQPDPDCEQEESVSFTVR